MSAERDKLVRQLADDAMFAGQAFVRRLPDGTLERLEPARVYVRPHIEVDPWTDPLVMAACEAILAIITRIRTRDYFDPIRIKIAEGVLPESASNLGVKTMWGIPCTIDPELRPGTVRVQIGRPTPHWETFDLEPSS